MASDLETVLKITRFRVAEPDGALPFSFADSTLPPLCETGEILEGYEASRRAIRLKPTELLRVTRYAVATFFAQQSGRVILSAVGHIYYKLFLNGIYLGAVQGHEPFHFFSDAKKGENRLCLEFVPETENAVEESDLNLRVRFESADSAARDSAQSDSLFDLHRGAQFYFSDYAPIRQNRVSCILLPRDRGAVKSADLSAITEDGTVLLTVPFPIGKETELDLAECRKKSETCALMAARANIVFQDGTTVIRSQNLQIRDVSEVKTEFRNLFTRAENQETLTESERLRIEDSLHPVDFSIPDRVTRTELTRLIPAVSYLNARLGGEMPHPAYKTAPGGEYFYRSDVTGSVRKLRFSVPKEPFDSPFALCVFINFRGLHNLSLAASHLNARKDTIGVECYLDGFPSGAPIGEALIFEAIDEAKRLFPIDESRIFTIGFCSNAYAAWNLLQGYPHRFAGGVSIDAEPKKENLRNLSEHKILCRYSSESLKQTHSAITRTLKNATVIPSELPHCFLEETLFKKRNFEILSHIAPKYPPQIRFRTETMRHRRAYWFQFNEITAGKKFASVFAFVTERNRIELTLRNTRDVSVEIPPRVSFPCTVTINGFRCDPIEETPERIFRFVFENGAFRCFAEPDFPIPDSRKGCGISDVYARALRIFHAPTPEAKILARAFANPYVNTFTPQLNLSIPVDETFPAEELYSDRNLILIFPEDEKTLAPFRDRRKIRIDPDGYTYLGSRKKGDYCVLQTYANPHHPDRTVLEISSNCPKRYLNHFLLRRITLPSWLSDPGIMNAEAIVFFEDKLFTVREWGASQTEIGESRQEPVPNAP